MLSVTAVGVDPNVNVDGEKLHAAYTGRFEQPIVTVPLNVPDSLTFRLKLAGCPVGTVALVDPAGGGNTKSGSVPVPESAIACEPAPVALTVSVALSLPAVEGLKATVIVQVAAGATADPQLEVAV
jgi:hypothetical protein